MRGRRIHDMMDDFRNEAGVEEHQTEWPDAEAIRVSEKALCVKLPGHGERWVPQSQITDDSEVWRKGDKGTLRITSWLAGKWAEEGPGGDGSQAAGARAGEVFFVHGAAGMGESAKALLVRLGLPDSEVMGGVVDQDDPPGRPLEGAAGRELWIPHGQIDAASEVKNEGDLGELRITAWIAKQKGLL